MSLKEIRTLDDVATAIIRRARLDDNSTVRADLYEKINTKYQQVAYAENYSWSGAQFPITLKAKYATGTLTATNASETLTGSSTSWSQASHEGCRIKIGSSPYPYKILRVASTTSIVIDQPYTGTTASSLSYTIFRDEYGLMPDLHQIRRLRIPGLGRPWPLEPCSPEEIDRFRDSSPFQAGLPRRYTTFGFNIYSAVTWADFKINTNFWEDDYVAKPKNKNLIIWPAILDSDRIATVRYTKIVEPMGSTTDEPLMPYPVRAVLVYGVLVENFLQGRDPVTQREWLREYKDLKRTMEGDIDSTSDELIAVVDRVRNQRLIGEDLVDELTT